MIYLYYTVSSGDGNTQTKPSLSLGGFKAGNKLSNGQLSNLFDSISPVTVSRFNQNQYRGLVLKNEIGTSATNVCVWFVYPTSAFAKLRIAAVTMVEDSDGNLQMERIENGISKPVYATFYECDGEANKVNIGNLASGEAIGIWIERELDIVTIQDSESDIYELSDPTTGLYKEKTIDIVEEIQMNIGWD